MWIIGTRWGRRFLLCHEDSEAHVVAEAALSVTNECQVLGPASRAFDLVCETSPALLQKEKVKQGEYLGQCILRLLQNWFLLEAHGPA